jgi:hypothetical protein
MSIPQHAAPLVFTPSERVFLFGDRFARPAGMLGYGEVVLTSGAKVSADDLAVHTIAAAYLACEQAGAVRLEPRQGKAMFGLMKTSDLHVVPGQRMVFTSVDYTLPRHARAAAEHGGTQHVHAMLESCRQQRPQLWNDLTQAIKAAITWMTSSND